MPQRSKYEQRSIDHFRYHLAGRGAESRRVHDPDEKVRIARALERMRVDVIEAGFPIASPGDFEAVKAVARAVQDSTVCGLARALDKDIDRAGEALKPAASARIHTFIATSPIHMKMKLRMEPDQVSSRRCARSNARAPVYG